MQLVTFNENDESAQNAVWGTIIVPQTKNLKEVFLVVFNKCKFCLMIFFLASYKKITCVLFYVITGKAHIFQTKHPIFISSE